MFTFEQLKQINEKLETIDIEKKDKKSGQIVTTKYVLVKDKVKAFREICPGGTISTEILSMANGVVTIKATIRDEDGNTISTGLAQEKESNGFINATSVVENSETSAVGRALAFGGIGIDGSLASADEVANAMINQTMVTEEEKAAFAAICKAAKVDFAEILTPLGWKKGQRISREQYTKALESITERLNTEAE